VPTSRGVHIAVALGYLLVALRSRRVTRLATTDAKTGLLAADAWQREAARQLKRARRSRAAVALVMLDVDGFKAVNDRAGHVAGDDVLAEIGRCLRSTLRTSDVVGRFGGDEFVALLRLSEPADALMVAARIRERIAARTSVTVSIGVAHRPALGSTDLKTLLRRADGALYAAKPGRHATGPARPQLAPALELDQPRRVGQPGFSLAQNASRPDDSLSLY
jgi:diguanylate cyclase (GGDEF)-like protein